MLNVEAKLKLRNDSLTNCEVSQVNLLDGEVMLAKISSEDDISIIDGKFNIDELPAFIAKVGSDDKNFSESLYLCAKAIDVFPWAKKQNLDIADIPELIVDSAPVKPLVDLINQKHPYDVDANNNAVFAADVMANKNISLAKTAAGLTSVRTSHSELQNTVGDLSSYWQFSENTSSVITAINQNADWVLRNFEQTANKTQNLSANKTSDLLYPSAKAVYDLFGPHIIYDDPTGFEANDKDVGNWQLTGLDLTPYKRVKFYIKAAESGSTGSPSHIVEIHLDDRARNAQGHFTGGHTAIFPDADSKFHNVVCSVSSDKTAVGFNRCHRYSASTSATSLGGRYCYLIEGYKI